MSENFMYDEPKTLPVILLLDTSGSMSGEKIASLNQAVNTMIKSFQDLDSIVATISVGIIGFGSNVSVISELKPANEVGEISLSAGGMTPFGGALRICKEIVDDKEKFPHRSYRPTIVCVSDGMPNDDWQNVLNEFKTTGRTSKCSCMAMSIGAPKGTPAYNVLVQFAGDEENVFFTDSAKDIYKFFQFVTTTIKTRTQSSNPNMLPRLNACDAKDIAAAEEEEDELF